MVVPQSPVANQPGIRPLVGPNTLGNNVEHEKGLEGLQIARLEQEALELGVKLTLQSLIPRRENGNIVVADSFFKSLQKQSFFHKFRELGVVGIEEGNEDGVGVDLTRRRFGRRVITGQCGKGGGGKREEKEEEEEDRDTIDGRIHGAHEWNWKWKRESE